MTGAITVRPVETRADRTAFVDFAWTANRGDPHWVPPLKSEVHGLLDPAKNPWFEHADARLFLAEQGGRVVGRISAQVDRLVLESMGAGTGQWGFLEADDGAVAAALLAAAEAWLRGRGLTRSLGPFSLSIWDEPGLLVQGHDHSPTVMMGHNRPDHAAWVEGAGYRGVKDLFTYEVDISHGFPGIVQRIVTSGERSSRINIREVEVRRFDAEAALILGILNDAWSDNWGFVPLTDAEIAYAGKKLKPIVRPELIRIAEVEGEAVAFMMVLPDINEYLADLDGRLFPFGWAKLLWRMRGMQVRTMRVPLMGVVKRLQSSRLASQLAFMMIEYIRRDAIDKYGASRGEIGWILDDNQGMVAIADAIESRINRVYRVYEKPL